MLRKRSERLQWAEAAEHRILRKANQNPKLPCVVRVLQLLELMKEAELLRLRLYEHWPGRYEVYFSDPIAYVTEHGYDDVQQAWDDSKQKATKDEFQALQAKIEKRMKRYHWTPTVRRSFWFRLEEMYYWPKHTEDENWENWAVFWLMRHVRGEGRLPAPILRFRRCRHCSKWLYALTDHQAYCSNNCRQKDHANSTEFRAKRARYMRERYRPQQKEREQRALEGVKHAKAKKA